MIRLFAFGLAFAAAVAAPVTAALATFAPSQGAVAAPTAAALARTVAPAELMVPIEVDVGRKMILSLPTVDEDAKALEAEYPGIWQAVWVAIEPEFRQSAQTDFPNFWSRMEKLYASRLTEVEAQAILAFYRSPTGQRMLRTIITGVDPAPVIASLVKSPDGTVSAEQLKSASDAARAKVLQSIGPADDEHMARLTEGISLDKFRSIGAATQQLTLEWVNEDDPAFEAKVGGLIEAAMEKYIADRSRGQ